ncbi:MAG: glycosyltransferase family 4 protein [Candidatus Altiarchaeota archaeon]
MAHKRLDVPVQIPKDGDQLDFTILPEPAGREWAKLMGHKQKLHMNILEVVASFERVGGTETYLKGLNAALLKDNSVNIHLVYRTNDPTSEGRTESLGGSSLTLHPVYMTDRDFSNRIRRTVILSRRINDVLREEEIDVVNLHSVVNPTISASCIPALLKHVPLVVTSHAETPPYTGRSLMAFATKILTSAILKLADRKTGVSIPSARLLGSDTVVIGSMCDSTFFDPDAPGVDALSFKGEIGVKDEKIILYPSRIVRPKGQLDFVKACISLREKFGGTFKAVIVGPDHGTQYYEELIDFIHQNKLDDIVLVLPTADKKRLRNMYAASDHVVFPSYSEALGLVGLESLAMKKAVVAYATGGIPEIVRHLETGILVEKGDVSGLSEGMLRLLGDPELSRRLGENGRQLVISEYSPQKLAERYMAMYQELVRY